MIQQSAPLVHHLNQDLESLLKLDFLTWSQFSLLTKNPTGLLNIHAINLKDSNGYYGRKGPQAGVTDEITWRPVRQTGRRSWTPTEEASSLFLSLPIHLPPEPWPLSSITYLGESKQTEITKANLSKPLNCREHWASSLIFTGRVAALANPLLPLVAWLFLLTHIMIFVKWGNHSL